MIGPFFFNQLCTLKTSSESQTLKEESVNSPETDWGSKNRSFFSMKMSHIKFRVIGRRDVAGLRIKAMVYSGKNPRDVDQVVKGLRDSGADWKIYYENC